LDMRAFPLPSQENPERTTIRRPFLLCLLFVFSLFLLSLPSSSHAEEIRIAFLEFQVNGKDLDKDLGIAASERVQNVVVRNSRVFVVERTQFKNLAKEHELQYSALVDESTAIEIGKVAGADYVVLGSLNAMGSILFLTARLVDVQRGLVIEAFEVSSKQGVEGLYYALGDLGNQITTTLQRKGIAEASPEALPPTIAPTAPPAAPTVTPKPAAPTPKPAAPALPPTATPVPVDPSKSFSLGLQAFQRGDRAQAVRHWQDASQTGHVEATARLGECYYHGWGIGKNPGKAFALLKEAAEKGSSYARGTLHGIDPAKFASYREDYLTLGQQQPSSPKPPTPTGAPSLVMSAQEMYKMGGDFHYGRNGKPKDYTQAAEWYRKAANLGHGDAQTNVGYFYERGLGVSKNLKLAFEWYTRGAQSGSAAGQTNLGYYYEIGRETSVNYEGAVYWYRKAAEQGYPRGEYRLGRMYEKGMGVAPNSAEAARWYQKAGNQGYDSAQNALGRLYELGEGVPKDLKKAVSWYRKAAEQENSSAMFNLARTYEFGIGVTKNLDTAVSWYRKAAAKGHERSKEALTRLGKK